VLGSEEVNKNWSYKESQVAWTAGEKNERQQLQGD